MWQQVVYLMTYGSKVDIHDVVKEDPVVAAIHAHAEKYDAKTEFAFSYLQVSLTAAAETKSHEFTIFSGSLM